MPIGVREQQRRDERYRMLKSALDAAKRLVEDVEFRIQQEVYGCPFPIALVSKLHGREMKFYEPFEWSAKAYNEKLVEHKVFDEDGKRLDP